MIYLLTAIGLTPGGNSIVHIYTQTIHKTTQSTQTVHRTTQFTNTPKTIYLFENHIVCVYNIYLCVIFDVSKKRIAEI